MTEDFETMAFDNVKVGADTRDEVYATLNIELKDRPNIPATLKAKVDTGAQGNVLPLRTYKRMYPSYIAADGLPKRGTLENTDMSSPPTTGSQYPSMAHYVWDVRMRRTNVTRYSSWQTRQVLRSSDSRHVVTSI